MIIEVVQSPGCTKCKASIEAVKQVVSAYPQIELKILSVTEDLERMVELGILTTPCIVIDGKIIFNWIPKEKELRGKIEGLLKGSTG